MCKPEHNVMEYYEVITECWKLFKMFYPESADIDKYTEEETKLDAKFRGNLRQYCFYKEMHRVIFNELNEIKKQQNKGE